jgi:hypothetical protein
MKGRPFYAVPMLIVLPPLLIFILNVCLILLFGMKLMDDYMIDKLLHVLGGVSISYSFAGILWHLIRRNAITLQDQTVYRAVVFGFLCFVVIAWEVFEFIIAFKAEFLTYSDTITDMICGLIGGALVCSVLRLEPVNRQFSK